MSSKTFWANWLEDTKGPCLPAFDGLKRSMDTVFHWDNGVQWGNIQGTKNAVLGQFGGFYVFNKYLCVFYGGGEWLCQGLKPVVQVSWDSFSLRKYISCVLTIRGGRRYSAVGLCMWPSWYMALIAWVTSSATCFVWSSSSSLYVSLSERCSRPVLIYSCLSCITTIDPLSAFFMIISFLFLRAICWHWLIKLFLVLHGFNLVASILRACM